MRNKRRIKAGVLIVSWFLERGLSKKKTWTKQKI